MSGKPAVPVVIDTNVLVPSIYSFTHIAKFIYEGNMVLIWNQFIYSEACEIINRLSNYYLKKANIQVEEVIRFLDYFVSIGRKVPDMPEDWPPVIVNDRDDDNFLWAALMGEAEYIISCDDSHMLKLKKYMGIPIGTPRGFFDWVRVVHPMSV